MPDMDDLKDKVLYNKVIKNPFAKIHQAAIDNGGSLPDSVR